MRDGGKILAQIMKEFKKLLRPGIATNYLNKLAGDFISFYTKKYPEADIKPAFLGYKSNLTGLDKPYPALICTSINEEVVHSLPSDRVLKDGDILSLDFGIVYKNLIVDMAFTIGIGKISKEAKKLIEVNKNALDRGIKAVKPGNTVGSIGYAIQSYVESQGFNVVYDLGGHGVGYKLHEEPFVPNYGEKGKGVVLKPGMVIAIEPIITTGSGEVFQDGWVWKTKDHSLASHFEHTVSVSKSGYLILTK